MKSSLNLWQKVANLICLPFTKRAFNLTNIIAIVDSFTLELCDKPKYIVKMINTILRRLQPALMDVFHTIAHVCTCICAV